MRVLERPDKFLERPPKLVDVLRGLGKVIREIHFCVCHPAKFVDGELEAILVFVDESLDFKEVVLLKGVEKLLDVVPHLGFDLSRAVAQSEG